jgi:hypothetical protein
LVVLEQSAEDSDDKAIMEAELNRLKLEYGSLKEGSGEKLKMHIQAKTIKLGKRKKGKKTIGV